MATTDRTAAQHAGTAGVAMAVAVVLAFVAQQAGVTVPTEIISAVAAIIGYVGSVVGLPTK